MAEEQKEEIGTGEETKAELLISNYLATGIHLFLSVLALLLLIAAVIATYDTVTREFPLLWKPQDEYAVLQKIVETLLLIAIVAEFALLLLFRRMSAVVEVVVFVLARKPSTRKLPRLIWRFARRQSPDLSFYDFIICPAKQHKRKTLRQTFL